MLMSLSRLSFVAGVSLVAALAAVAPAAATVTRLTGSPGQWQLIRDGKPYFIHGVGGGASMTLLKSLGGNSVRTWGADDLGRQLDEAQKLGLSVCVGIWLGHEDRINNFNYDDPKQVAKQFETAKAAILKYKDHPAVLMWGIGNEMEGPTGEKASMWKAVNDIAAFAKKVDPNHPTMTVLAEIGENAVKIKNLAQHCPDIDIVGVNSYGGGLNVGDRYAAAGVTKPYVITEYGPIGFWEGGHAGFGSPIEPTSTEKAAMYERTYKNTIAGKPGRCLGGYAFLWGNKQETTATWFGLLLPDGTKTAAVDVVAAGWANKPAVIQAPSIEPIKIEGADRVAPGEIVKASVESKSPTNRPLTYEWQLHAETVAHGEGGSYEPENEKFDTAVQQQNGPTASVTMPTALGKYRLSVTVRDDNHYAATANVPLLVAKPEAADTTPAGGLKKPVTLYADNTPDSGYVPSGWIGNTSAIALDPKSTTTPHSGATCMKCTYKTATEFGGVAWQSPANNWGTEPGGRDLRGAKRLAFWARGEQGGEKVEFKFGILDGDQKYKDSAGGATTVTLTPQWKRYAIDLAGKDLSQILTGFCWVTAGQGKPVTFYLDDIAYE